MKIETWHADSLAGPMGEMKKAFEAKNTGFTVNLTSGRSKELAERALGELTKRQDGIDQITVEVSSFDPLYGLGQWYVGDTARVKVQGWLSVPDGVHNTRIIHASGDFKDTVKIDFQEGVLL